MTATARFTECLVTLFDEGDAAFFVQTTEEARLDALLGEFAARTGLDVEEWNLAHGWVPFESKRPREDAAVQPRSLAHDLGLLRELDADTLCVIKDLGLALRDDKQALGALRELLARLRDRRRGRMTVVLVSDAAALPAEIEHLVTCLDLPLPAQDEMDCLVAREAKRLGLRVPGSMRPRLSAALSGMSEYDAVRVLGRLRRQGDGLTDAMLASSLEEKRRLVARSGVLEMVALDAAADAVGGLERLRTWLGQQAGVFQRRDEARRRGVSLPKGVLLAGLPGCGKSLSARAAAEAFGLPLLRIDMGSLLGKYVGESEQNLRRALATAGAMSPCVLWIDELEKAFAGRAGAQSEVNASMLGYLLHWLQEKRDPVFVFATANDIGVLPPELLRKGRFDELFYVDLPTQAERGDIFAARLRAHGQDPRRFDLDALARASRDFSGADIAAAVGDALRDAFLGHAALDQATLLDAVQACAPMKKNMGQQVAAYEALFRKHNLRPASGAEGASASPPPGAPRPAARPDLHGMSEVQLMELAASHALASDTLAFLARHRSPAVRGAAARNGRLDPTTEAWLVQDRDASVRAALASNGRLSPAAQHSLVADPSEQVRARLAANRHVAAELRSVLACDSSSRVRRQVEVRNAALVA